MPKLASLAASLVCASNRVLIGGMTIEHTLDRAAHLDHDAARHCGPIHTHTHIPGTVSAAAPTVLGEVTRRKRISSRDVWIFLGPPGHHLSFRQPHSFICQIGHFAFGDEEGHLTIACCTSANPIGGEDSGQELWGLWPALRSLLLFGPHKVAVGACGARGQAGGRPITDLVSHEGVCRGPGGTAQLQGDIDALHYSEWSVSSLKNALVRMDGRGGGAFPRNRETRLWMSLLMMSFLVLQSNFDRGRQAKCSAADE